MVDVEGGTGSDSEVVKGDQLELETLAETGKTPESEPLEQDKS